MSYIETPREVYKQRFDLVVKQIIDTNQNIINLYKDFYNGDYEDYTEEDYEALDPKDDVREKHHWDSIKRFFKLTSPEFTREEVKQLSSIIYDRFCSDKELTSETVYGWRLEDYLNAYLKTNLQHPLLFRLWTICLHGSCANKKCKTSLRDHLTLMFRQNPRFPPEDRWVKDRVRLPGLR